MKSLKLKNSCLLGNSIRKWSLLSIFTLLLVSLYSCHSKHPKDVLSPEQMEEVLYDFHISNAMANLVPDSFTFYAHYYFHKTLNNHKLTEEEFEHSLLWYTQHTEHLDKIYEHINTRIDGENQSLGVATSTGNLYASLSAEGDTANLWTGRKYYVLSPIGVRNRISFNLEADSTYLPGDNFIWHFKNIFVFGEDKSEAVVNLSVVYKNDSVQEVTSHSYETGDFSLHIYPDRIPIRAIRGFVYLNASWSSKSHLMFILNPSLVRIHDKTQPVDTIPDSLKVSSTLDSLSVDSHKQMRPNIIGIHNKPVPLRRKISPRRSTMRK